MQMVKIQIPDRAQRAKGIAEITLRGQVICLPDHIFVVPEPALEPLNDLLVTFTELGRGGFDYALKSLRDAQENHAKLQANPETVY